eukprot:787032-Lingulodinium_polyedra.AAC.1
MVRRGTSWRCGAIMRDVAQRGVARCSAARSGAGHVAWPGAAQSGLACHRATWLGRVQRSMALCGTAWRITACHGVAR